MLNKYLFSECLQLRSHVNSHMLLAVNRFAVTEHRTNVWRFISTKVNQATDKTQKIKCLAALQRVGVRRMAHDRESARSAHFFHVYHNSTGLLMQNADLV